MLSSRWLQVCKIVEIVFQQHAIPNLQTQLHNLRTKHHLTRVLLPPVGGTAVAGPCATDMIPFPSSLQRRFQPTAIRMTAFLLGRSAGCARHRRLKNFALLQSVVDLLRVPRPWRGFGPSSRPLLWHHHMLGAVTRAASRASSSGNRSVCGGAKPTNRPSRHTLSKPRLNVTSHRVAPSFVCILEPWR